MIPSSIYDIILEKAKPYLDTRQNESHTIMSFDFAQRLLSFYPEANADIVLPAILLHDVGWKMVPEDQQLSAFGPNMNNFEIRRLHEIEGVRIADEILTSLHYDNQKIKEILLCIDGHDSREVALSINDAIVKDADKLFRYTSVAVEIDYARFNMSREDRIDMLERSIGLWFFTEEAKEMAGTELSNVLPVGDSAGTLLQTLHSEER